MSGSLDKRANLCLSRICLPRMLKPLLISGADRAVELILLGVKGEKMPLRNVAPYKKTIKLATGCLRGNDWVKHADIIDAFENDGDQEEGCD
jgi:hypothetical protein